MRNEKEYPYVDEIDGVEVVYFSLVCVVGKWVTVSWASRNKKYYITMGYRYTKIKDSFIVDVRDLMQGSNAVGKLYCPDCDNFRLGQIKPTFVKNNTQCRSHSKIINLVGEKYNRLIVKKFVETRKGNAYWECLCDCGKITVVCASLLKSSGTKSCGCYKEERMKGKNNPMYGRTGPANPRYGKKGVFNGVTGANHPGWNPNLTDEHRINKRVNQYPTFSLPIFKRDNFVCQISGSKGKRDLEAHHLDDQSTNPEKAFDIDNGITTRRKYHREFHSWLGGTQVPCTKQDMIDFCKEFYPDAPFLKSVQSP